jgi:hypothetical protein
MGIAKPMRALGGVYLGSCGSENGLFGHSGRSFSKRGGSWPYLTMRDPGPERLTLFRFFPRRFPAVRCRRSPDEARLGHRPSSGSAVAGEMSSTLAASSSVRPVKYRNFTSSAFTRSAAASRVRASSSTSRSSGGTGGRGKSRPSGRTPDIMAAPRPTSYRRRAWGVSAGRRGSKH